MNNPKALNDQKVICTSCSKNHLARARVFVESAKRTNPGIPIFVLIVESSAKYPELRDENFNVLFVDELDNIPNAKRLFFKFDQMELNALAKPHLLEFLFTKIGADKICYFDSDMLPFDSLTEIWELLDRSSMVITPHIFQPYPDQKTVNELGINIAGLYNAGFFAMAKTPSTARILEWWGRRTREFGYIRPVEGIHAEQNWMNFIPLFFENVEILRSERYNIAHWNLHERGSRLSYADGQLLIDGIVASSYHFSGYSPDEPDVLSKYSSRYTFDDLPALLGLFNNYHDQLIDNGYNELIGSAYSFSEFANGCHISKHLRAIFGSLDPKHFNYFDDPFDTLDPVSFYHWLLTIEDGDDPKLTHYHFTIYRERPDLQAAFPDPNEADRLALVAWFLRHGVEEYDIDPRLLPFPPITQAEHEISQTPEGGLDFVREKGFWDQGWLQKLGKKRFAGALWVKQEKLPAVNNATIDPHLPFGVNVSGHFMGEFGLAEFSRLSAGLVEKAGIPNVKNIVYAHGNRNQDQTLLGFTDENPYRVNLIHINADEMLNFALAKGKKYFNGRYSIGYWFWELPEFNQTWQSAFQPLDEVWVASEFCLQSIQRASPIPVVKMPHPLMFQEPLHSVGREYFELPKHVFIFGFSFDYNSSVVRKNPLAVIEAFNKAFGTSKDVMLVIKSINASFFPQDQAILRSVAGGCNIKFIDAYYSRSDMDGLLSCFDAYISLHRSEGFGLGMAHMMAYGKPVIATKYSGNLEFMNDTNSYLVDNKLVELETDHLPYSKGNIWAEPDTEHAAILMRSVFEDLEKAQRVGAIAKQSILEQFSIEKAISAYSERIKRVAG